MKRIGIILSTVIVMCSILFLIYQYFQSGIPTSMPADFAVSLQYGVDGKNSINTYNNTITKDLVENGLTSIEYIPSKEELETIYKTIVKYDLYKINKPLVNKNVSVDENQEFILNFTINGEDYHVYGDSSMYNLKYNKPAKNYSSFINYMVSYIESTSAYQSLPNS